MLISVDAVKLKMINYFEHDLRRINHALKVHSFAHLLMNEASVSDEKKLIIEIAALLHDIGIKEAEKKYHSSAGHYQELEGPEVAKTLLKPFQLKQPVLDRVLFLIGSHHSYSKIDGIDFQILVESDFLVNIDEDAIDKTQIPSLQQKYFKTEAGNHLVSHLFL